MMDNDVIDGSGKKALRVANATDSPQIMAKFSLIQMVHHHQYYPTSSCTESDNGDQKWAMTI